MPARVVNERLYNQIIELKDAGHNAKDIAGLVGLKLTTVYGYLNGTMKIPRRRPLAEGHRRCHEKAINGMFDVHARENWLL